jgi:hypothetical protein
VVAASGRPEYVDPRTVSAEELKTLLSVEALPPGFRLVAEAGGRTPWGAPGDDWQATYAERLYEDDGANRVAVRVVVTGTALRGDLSRYDALCSKTWTAGDCGPQYNAYRYTQAATIVDAGERAFASTRQCFAEACGADRAVPGAPVHNQTFVRAGMVVTLSVQSRDETLDASAADILVALDERLSAVAKSRGVDVASSARVRP